jgi:hypothetical protein
VTLDAYIRELTDMLNRIEVPPLTDVWRLGRWAIAVPLVSSAGVLTISFFVFGRRRKPRSDSSPQKRKVKSFNLPSASDDAQSPWLRTVLPVLVVWLPAMPTPGTDRRTSEAVRKSQAVSKARADLCASEEIAWQA